MKEKKRLKILWTGGRRIHSIPIRVMLQATGSRGSVSQKSFRHFKGERKQYLDQRDELKDFSLSKAQRRDRKGAATSFYQDGEKWTVNKRRPSGRHV